MSQRFNSLLQAAIVGDRLRQARRKSGKSLEQTAKELRVHHSQVSRIERGKINTVSPIVHKLCTKFSVRLPAAMALDPESLAERVQILAEVAPDSCQAIDAVVCALEALAASKQAR